MAACRLMEKRYKKIAIPKSSGGLRIIHAPDDDLKMKQRQLLYNEYRTGIGAGPYATGFVRNKGIKEHASAHVGRNFIVHLDIKDFFPNVTPEHVKRAWEAENLTPAELETRFKIFPNEAVTGKRILDIPPPLGLIQFAFIPSPLDMFKLGLPQGSALSPFLANMAFKIIDFKLAKFMREQCPEDGRYTRYADNLAFSSNKHKVVGIVGGLCRIIEANGFKLNRAKFHVMRKKSGRQILCGIVINEKLNIPRDARRNHRAAVNQIKKAAVLGVNKEGKAVTDWKELKNELTSLKGWFSFARHINPKYFDKYSKDLLAAEAIIDARLTI